MEVDFEGGRAIVLPAAEESFDPIELPKAIKRAGFTPGEIELTAVGELVLQGERLLLKLCSPPLRLTLDGGAQLESLVGQAKQIDETVRIHGLFLWHEDDRTATLSVEAWERVASRESQD